MKLDIQLRKYSLWIERYDTSPYKPALDILLRHRGKEGLAKGAKELELAPRVCSRWLAIPSTPHSLGGKARSDSSTIY